MAEKSFLVFTSPVFEEFAEGAGAKLDYCNPAVELGGKDRFCIRSCLKSCHP